MKKYIAYYRVRRKVQGISGLGLSAQKSSVEKYVAGQDGIILKEFTEQPSMLDYLRKMAILMM